MPQGSDSRSTTRDTGSDTASVSTATPSSAVDTAMTHDTHTERFRAASIFSRRYELGTNSSSVYSIPGAAQRTPTAAAANSRPSASTFSSSQSCSSASVVVLPLRESAVVHAGSRLRSHPRR